MPTLHIELQDGFADDEVTIRAGGRVIEKRGVSTDYSIGLAEQLSVELPAGRAPVEIEMPRRGLSKKIEADPSQHAHLGVSLIDGALIHEFSAEPFPHY
jgi:hypothetical protein